MRPAQAAHRLAANTRSLLPTLWPVSLAVLGWTHTSSLLERSAEGGRVIVAGVPSYSVDRVARCFEQALRELGTSVLNIRLRAPPGSAYEPTRECAATQSELICQLTDPEQLIEVPIDVLLNLLHDEIVVKPSW